MNHLLCLFTLIALYSFSPPVFGQTAINISFQNNSGAALVPDRILLFALHNDDTHNYSYYQLEVTGARLTLSMDSGPLWRQPLNKYRNMVLCVEKKGYATGLFGPLYWKGVNCNLDDTDAHAAITSSQGVISYVKKNQQPAYTLTLKKHVPRVLRFEDTKGEPLAGVRVEAQMLLDDSTYLGPPQYQLERISNNKGQVMLPHFDTYYEVTLTKTGYHLQNMPYDPEAGLELTQRLKPNTTFVMEQASDRSFSLKVFIKGKPVNGLKLMNICWECFGRAPLLVGTSDPQGRIEVSYLDPLLAEPLFLMNQNWEILWSGSLNHLLGGKHLQLNLNGTIIPRPDANSDGSNKKGGGEPPPFAWKLVGWVDYLERAAQETTSPTNRESTTSESGLSP